MTAEYQLETVPSQPDPPVIGKVTYHSIELYWHPPSLTGYTIPTEQALLYCIQEEDTEKGNGFVTVYEGTELYCTCTGLSPSTKYRYRLRASNEIGPGPWSPIVTVSTTRHAVTSEHLHKAVANGDVDTVRSILDNDPHYLDVPDIHGASPLMVACKQGRKRVVDLLLNLGANIEYSNTAGKTSMMEACYHGYNGCIMLLHNAGASWFKRDASGMSALHWAVDGEQLETIELLLTEGFPVDDISDMTVSGWTPLLRVVAAATNGNAAIARQLIHHGADINRRDHEGQTPLMLATLGGHIDMVSLLLNNRCDWKVKNKYNKTAFDFAMSFEREEIATLLKKVKAEDAPTI